MRRWVLALIRQCLRCMAGHVRRHHRKYASGAMIYAALFVFGVDAVASLHLIPPNALAWIEDQRWTVPLAALAGHAGFILERTA